MNLHVMSVLIWSDCPNMIRFCENDKFRAWIHRRFNMLHNSFQKSWTLSHCHNKWSMVSLWTPQNVHESFCSMLYLETDLLVDKILWSILNWNQCSFVSLVVLIRIIKEFNQVSGVIPTLAHHLFWPVIVVGFSINLLYILDAPYFVCIINSKCGW